MNEVGSDVVREAEHGDVVRPVQRLYAGYAFDLDGTLYLGGDALLGAADTVAELRRLGSAVAFVTNKPLEGAPAYAHKLTGLGIPAEPEEVVSSLDALRLYLATYHPGASVVPVGEPLVHESLADWGHPEAPANGAGEGDVVVVSFDRTFDYAKLLTAYRAVRAGAVIVATNPDAYCPTPDGGLPDCAAILAALEACTGVPAEAVVGKPSLHMAAAFLDRLGTAPGESAFVGDRIETDVAMGHAAGMAGILVLTGATEAHQVRHYPVHPDAVLRSVAELLP